MKKRVTQINNTKQLQKQITNLLGKSEMWMVIRMDSDGVHVHLPNEEHLAVLDIYFAQNPGMLNIVEEFIHIMNSKKN